MIFAFGSFKIDVDVEATRAFYDRAPSLIVPCACNGCRNFQLAIRQTPDEVQRFFSDLGADIASPAETWIWDVVPDESGTHLWYGGFYNLCGEILAGDGQWKPQHKDSCIYHSGCPPYHLTESFSVSFQSQVSLIHPDFPSPAFQMDIDAHLPWVLDEEIPQPFFVPAARRPQSSPKQTSPLARMKQALAQRRGTDKEPR